MKFTIVFLFVLKLFAVPESSHLPAFYYYAGEYEKCSKLSKIENIADRVCVMKCNLKAGNYKKALSIYESIKISDKTLLNLCMMDSVFIFYGLKMYDRVVSVSEKIKNFPDRVKRIVLKAVLKTNLKSMKNLTLSKKWKAFLDYEKSKSVESLKRLVLLDPCSYYGKNQKNLKLSKNEKLKVAIKLFSCRRYDDSAKLFEFLLKFKDTYPAAAYHLALIHGVYLRDNRKRAVKLLLSIKDTKNSLRSEIIYHIARFYANLEDYENSRKFYKLYIKNFPHGRYIKRAYYYMGWLYFDRKEYKKALKNFLKYYGKFNKSSLKTYVIWFIAWSYYRIFKYQKAIRFLKRLIPFGNPLVRGKAYYWIGRIYEKLGKTRGAVSFYLKVKKEYPLTYYSLLAELRLKKLGIIRKVSLLTKNDYHSLKWCKNKAIQNDYALRFNQIENLIRAGFFREAQKIALKKISPKKLLKHQNFCVIKNLFYDRLFLYHPFYEQLKYTTTFSLGKKRSDYLRYPRPFKQYVEFYSKKFSIITKFLIYSIMRQESGYNPNKISWTDAHGIMQVQPQTARKLSSFGVIDFKEKEELLLPGVNIKFGTFYISKLLKKFKNQIIFAAAAYNAGAKPVERFLKINKGLPFDEMVEEIAYNEARNYARKVTEHLIRYLYLYESKENIKKIIPFLFPEKVDYEIKDEFDI